MFRSLLTPALVVVALAIATGCRRDARVTCGGNVRYGGVAVEEGSIGFFPIEAGVRSEGAVITKGRYEIRVVPGRHRVEIRGSRAIDSTRAGPIDIPGPIREDFIPATFNADSTLTVDVPPGGNRSLSFDLAR